MYECKTSDFRIRKKSVAKISAEGRVGFEFVQNSTVFFLNQAINGAKGNFYSLKGNKSLYDSFIKYTFHSDLTDSRVTSRVIHENSEKALILVLIRAVVRLNTDETFHYSLKEHFNHTEIDFYFLC